MLAGRGAFSVERRPLGMNCLSAIMMMFVKLELATWTLVGLSSLLISSSINCEYAVQFALL